MVAKTIDGVAGGIAQEGGTVKGSFGQIIFGVVCRKVFVFQCNIWFTKTGWMEQTFGKHVVRIFSLRKRDRPPTKKRRQSLNGRFSFASTARRARDTRPIVWFSGGVVEILLRGTFIGPFPFLKKRKKRRWGGNWLIKLQITKKPKKQQKADSRDHGKQPIH